MTAFLHAGLDCEGPASWAMVQGEGIWFPAAIAEVSDMVSAILKFSEADAPKMGPAALISLSLVEGLGRVSEIGQNMRRLEAQVQNEEA